MSKLRISLAATISAALTCLAAAPVQAAPGDLTQKPGLAACVTEGGAPACADAVALAGPNDLEVSPDGASAYVASYDRDAVAVFDRAPDGTLTQKSGLAGCISQTGSGGACADGAGLDGAYAIAISSDGASVYVAAADGSALAILDRDPDGTLTQQPGPAGCISETGSGGACADGVALSAAQSVTVSPDGTSAYVTGGFGVSNAVAIFDRSLDGGLTQKPGAAGCLNSSGFSPCGGGVGLEGARAATVSPDGDSLYVAGGAAVTVFDRSPDGTLTQKPGTAGCISDDGSGGACTDAAGVAGAGTIAISPDGTGVYIAAQPGDDVAVFDRVPDGTLIQKPGSAGCISESGAAPCTDGVGLDGANSVVVSADGLNAYVSSVGSNAVASFDRLPDGSLTQKPGSAGCISESGAAPCADGMALDDPYSVAISPDGASVYAASYFSQGVAVFDRERLPAPPPPAPLPPTPLSATGKPYLKQIGHAGRTALRVRIGCGGEAACAIRLTGIRELNGKTGRPNGKTEAEASSETAASKSRRASASWSASSTRKYLARTIKRALAAANPVPPEAPDNRQTGRPRLYGRSASRVGG